MALTLLAGPANAGKVALLLERYLAVLEREPVLIVPNGADVERVERDLLQRCGVLFGGSSRRRSRASTASARPRARAASSRRSRTRSPSSRTPSPIPTTSTASSR